ncbi:MAG TPA: beta-ketoacyl-ACP reductase [Acidobacteriaceae bacterium]|nr:beta-ketoacyl-ACP reductase [Acidobacteriaceae bacterium]
MSGLSGRVALVTGASQGIGRACALELARMGATVALCARNEAKLAEVADEINSRGAGRAAVVAEAEGEIEDAAAGFRQDGTEAGEAIASVDVAGEEAAVEAAADGWGQAHVFALDVGDEESIKACAKAVIAQLGKVEILVNNAGITRDILSMRMKRADWDAVLATNLTGAFLMSQAVMSAMLKARWGRIINITSVVGETGQAGQANYAASKAGLIGLTKSLARELASRGITVNAVAPGYIETAMTAVLNDEQKSAMTSQIPLGRVGTDRDIAAAVAFLASEEAGYITGHTLDVNGGMYMG